MNEHVRQLMILAEVQVLVARIVHDPKNFQEISERIEEVKSMILTNFTL